ncbi:hypothetical protein LCGC14_0911440 [marine sediment metagenome]|uniref:Uncharacterized protein n=1 Tax=marine sediment metagenome TaxID=412755 RepID=A0A0F9PEA4_9ZZZZ
MSRAIVFVATFRTKDSLPYDDVPDEIKEYVHYLGNNQWTCILESSTDSIRTDVLEEDVVKLIMKMNPTSIMGICKEELFDVWLRPKNYNNNRGKYYDPTNKKEE